MAPSNMPFLTHCVSQYVDVPLAFYHLATLVTVFLGTTAGRQRRSVLALAGFKLFLAPAVNPMLTQRTADASARVLTTHRWVTLIEAVFTEALDLGRGLLHPLVILAIIVLAPGFRFVPRYRRSVLLGALAIATVFAGYCAVCVLNPTQLGTSRDTPFERLYSQLWPSFVFLVFMVLRTLEEIALPAVQQVHNTPVRRRKKQRSR